MDSLAYCTHPDSTSIEKDYVTKESKVLYDFCFMYNSKGLCEGFKKKEIKDVKSEL